MGDPSSYEQQAIEEIQRWKHRDEYGWRRVARVLSWPVDKAGDLVMATPGVGWVIEKAVGGLVTLLNGRRLNGPVRPAAIYDEYRANGDAIDGPRAIHTLDLQSVDRAIGSLKAKYLSIAALEGGAAGVVGLPGIPADIVALTGLSLRAVGEYATYCGFDVQLQHERLYASQMLGLGSARDAAAKSSAMAQLVKIAREVARKSTWNELERYTFVKVMQQLAKALGVRLTKAKLAQAVPAVGGVVGAGFNAYFVSVVCDASYHLYRERFLAEKYGVSIIRD